MKVIEARDYQEMSLFAANMITAQVILKPDSVLGLATGSTPVGTYQMLVERYGRGELDFSAIRTANLDEYVGLRPENDQSYRYFMQKNLFDHINIDPANTYIPDGTNTDAAAECARYDGVVEALGGIDLQLLGIGNNGHIGFNEPDAAFANGTHVVKLADSTIEANSRFFPTAYDVPKYAYTMGIGTIMRSRRVLLIASGEAKAVSLYKTIAGPIVPQVPASALQLHGCCTIIADAAALSVCRAKGVL